MIGFFAPEVVVEIERPSKSASVADALAEALLESEPFTEDSANASNPADAGAVSTGVFRFKEANKSFDGAGADVGVALPLGGGGNP